jgi:hypothetical protein
VSGVGAYSFINDLLYLELTGYQTLDPPLAMIAQAMRAILLATATATSLAGFLASSLMIQGCFCGCCRAC